MCLGMGKKGEREGETYVGGFNYSFFSQSLYSCNFSLPAPFPSLPAFSYIPKATRPFFTTAISRLVQFQKIHETFKLVIERTFKTNFFTRLDHHESHTHRTTAANSNIRC